METAVNVAEAQLNESRQQRDNLGAQLMSSESAVSGPPKAISILKKNSEIE